MESPAGVILMVYAAATTLALIVVLLWAMRTAAALHERIARAEAELAAARAHLAQERSGSREKLALVQAAREDLVAQFEVLGQRIFEEKSARFAAQNRESLSSLLNPLGEQIKAFEHRVNEVYDKESRERFSLQRAVRELADTGVQMSRETQNLTSALKGSAKARGTWGELVLERVLAASGLRRGEEYEVQGSFQAEDGSRLQPDVVLRLPEDKCVVIDSKVSLIAYERLCNAETEGDRDAALRQHLDSVRSHVRGLSAKRYQALPALRSPEFVLMFMPMESAFVAAVEGDAELGTWALGQGVLLVCPSTLLATLRLVSQMWSQELQDRHAREIARLCGQMYDKLVSFVGDLEDVGRKLDAARASQESAVRKLHTGRGNLVRTAERIRELGIKPQKSLPPALVEAAEEEMASSVSLAQLAAEEEGDAGAPSGALRASESTPKQT